MSNFLERWKASDENRKLVERELLILRVTEGIWGILEGAGISKADLAKKLETSKANITQLLDGSRNMTLKTLSDILFAINAKIELKISSRSEELQYSSFKPFRTAQRLLAPEDLECANEDTWHTVKVAEFPKIRKVA